MNADAPAAAAAMNVSLYFTDGRSDKEYHAQLVQEGDGWVVNFAYGRRGAALATGTKTASPVAYDKALRTYNALVKEKTAKGYVPDEAGRPFSVGEASAKKSGFTPQLSNAIDLEGDAKERSIEEMILSDEWQAQRKMDGIRRAVEIVVVRPMGINRRGLYVALPPNVEASYAGLPGGTIIDGELVGDTHYAFDLVQFGDRSLADTGFDSRFRKLNEILSGRKGTMILPPGRNAEEKRQMLAAIRLDDGEGVVFKKAAAPYRAGRPSSGGDSIKVKFWETATVRVAAVNDGKRSVEMEMLDGGAWIPVGNVTVPANQAIPAKGSLAEVRYLYAMTPSNALFQPTLLGIRTDVDEADCRIDQVKYKPAEAAAAEAKGPSPF